MLTICRASAGSGKTYKLTLEYLKLILRQEGAYQHILAVTFTNKATEEMKHRIVEKLDILAHNASQSEYAEELTAYLDISLAALQQQAREVLFGLLHNFTAFNISTIDSFFQQTTRAFTREIGLQGGYNLELDNSHVMSQAIDRMLFELENPEQKELLGWLLRFSEEKVERGLSWDIRKEMASLAGELFKESYKNHSIELERVTRDKSLLKTFQQKLQRQRALFENLLKECGTEALALMERFQLTPSHFKGGARSPLFHFAVWAKGEVKEPTATFQKLEGEVGEFYTSKTAADVVCAIEEAYAAGLGELVSRALNIFKTYPFYLTVVETGRYLYTLGILSDINFHIHEYEREHNILLLSDTTELLNKIIDGSDTPFVYEKIGTYIDHFMVDEFQDTSQMQWGNFQPLFQESLDRGNGNLIVGDVKQSIYRWRNSDWTLLNEGVNRAFTAYDIADEVLHTNWRSCANVVHFNNQFFQLATEHLHAQFRVQMEASAWQGDPALSEKIVGAYHDIYQQLPPHRVSGENQGDVSVRFVDCEAHEDWKEGVLEGLRDLLIELQDRGYALRDIAFLVRNNSEAALIAEELLRCKAENNDARYAFDLISDEALFVGSFPVVRFIVSILKYIQNPHDKAGELLAAYEYGLGHSTASRDEVLSQSLRRRKGEEGLFDAEFAAELEALKELPLFEMCERIIALFPSQGGEEGVFIQAFQDMVIEFTQRHAADLTSFLHWWDERGVNKTIATPEAQNALRITTIHKSKGLEFPVTILPFCEWDIDNTKHTSILWCTPPEELEGELPVIPIRYSAKLAQTTYAAPYFEEKMHNYIDSINLAYVAFTRAKESLILFTPKPKEKKGEKKGEITRLSDLLYRSVAEAAPPSLLLEGEEMPLHSYYSAEEGCLNMGKPSNRPPQAAQAKEVVTANHTYHSVDPASRLQLRLFGKGFFHDRKERIYGNLMHEVLSNITTAADIEPALQHAVRQGLITHTESEELVEKLTQWVNAEKSQHWFSPEAKVLNETAILQPEGTFYRPDRVVLLPDGVEIIDYKFGEHERPSYLKQVSRYMELVRKMGYNNVRGYLWYVTLQKIVNVEA